MVSSIVWFCSRKHLVLVGIVEFDAIYHRQSVLFSFTHHILHIFLIFDDTTYFSIFNGSKTGSYIIKKIHAVSNIP
jgi:hypothetical protein